MWPRRRWGRDSETFLKLRFFEVFVGAQVVSRNKLKRFVDLLPSSALLWCTMLFPSNILAQPRDRMFPAPQNFTRCHFITTPTSFPPHAFLKPEQSLVFSVSKFCYWKKCYLNVIIKHVSNIKHEELFHTCLLSKFKSSSFFPLLWSFYGILLSACLHTWIFYDL